MSSWREPQGSPQREALRLRAMQLADVGRVMPVERAAYEFPWSEGIFRDCLRIGYCCRVLEDGAVLVGHGIMSVAAGECHLLNICVHPDYQRRGLGRQLLLHLLDVARRRHACIAILEVRASNTAAFALYDGLGFHEVGIRKDYYPRRRGREDALVLARDL